MFERFWSKVNKNGPIHPVLKTRCWIWKGAKCGKGYGKFWYGKSIRAHRVAWFLMHGKWPTPCCLHRCDNRPCCNPDHLFEGVQQDNIKDMVEKGRSIRGGRHHMTKLMESDVVQLRAMYRSGKFTQAKLGELYGIAPETVSSIVLKRRWKYTA